LQYDGYCKLDERHRRGIGHGRDAPPSPRPTANAPRSPMPPAGASSRWCARPSSPR
jgi:hypothetical protein